MQHQRGELAAELQAQGGRAGGAGSATVIERVGAVPEVAASAASKSKVWQPDKKGAGIQLPSNLVPKHRRSDLPAAWKTRQLSSPVRPASAHRHQHANSGAVPAACGKRAPQQGEQSSCQGVPWHLHLCARPPPCLPPWSWHPSAPPQSQCTAARDALEVWAVLRQRAQASIGDVFKIEGRLRVEHAVFAAAVACRGRGDEGGS